ncbi:MAG TPA: MFS transporter [Jatrophihabitans sp.]|nr:MFS transporter [Jatrophihabitans sp.]
MSTAGGHRLGRSFGWLWSAYAISTVGTWLAFDAFPLIAIRVLHAGPAQVSLLAAAGLAVGALLAVPVGPWLEARPKRMVMIAMDLLRFAAMLTVPIGYAVGGLSFSQLVVVAVVVGAADITFTAASGAYLKSLVLPTDLLVANGRFESTMWTASMLGPPLGGALIGVLGPVVTVLANGISFLLSALGLGAISGAAPAGAARPAPIAGQVLATAGWSIGWRYLLRHPLLRPLFVNVLLVNSLIMAGAPLLAVLMLGRLGFAPWQYGLAFAVPCLGGLLGSRAAAGLVRRYQPDRVLRAAGTVRACWPLGLVLVRPGAVGLTIVIVVELGLVTSCAIFNPVAATTRLQLAAPEVIARTLAAWSVSTKAATALATATWGGLAAVLGPRAALGLAGLALLLTPLVLPRRADLAGVRQPQPASSAGVRF